LVAEEQGLRVHGTVGVIVRARRRGLRDRDQVLDLLEAIPLRTTLFLRTDLLEAVIAEVRER